MFAGGGILARGAMFALLGTFPCTIVVADTFSGTVVVAGY